MLDFNTILRIHSILIPKREYHIEYREIEEIHTLDVSVQQKFK